MLLKILSQSEPIEKLKESQISNKSLDILIIQTKNGTKFFNCLENNRKDIIRVQECSKPLRQYYNFKIIFQNSKNILLIQLNSLRAHKVVSCQKQR